MELLFQISGVTYLQSFQKHLNAFIINIIIHYNNKLQCVLLLPYVKDPQ